jgi:transposase-like protein
MSTLIKNSSAITPECGLVNVLKINDRSTEQLNQNLLADIRAQIMDLHTTVTASSNAKISKLKKATSFPIEDIQMLLANSPGCKYLRVYNGFKNGEFVTYIAAINNAFETYLSEDLTDSSVISQSCCHCNPCTTDRILNP